MMEFIYEMIDISNFLLLNYWYIILPVSIVLGVFMTYFYLKSEDNKEKNKR
jgi:hypothetical protein